LRNKRLATYVGFKNPAESPEKSLFGDKWGPDSVLFWCDKEFFDLGHDWERKALYAAQSNKEAASDHLLVRAELPLAASKLSRLNPRYEYSENFVGARRSAVAFKTKSIFFEKTWLQWYAPRFLNAPEEPSRYLGEEKIQTGYMTDYFMFRPVELSTLLELGVFHPSQLVRPEVGAAREIATDVTVNEVYLFHGARPGVLTRIANYGLFDRALNPLSWYGMGFYFTPQICKAHLYAWGDREVDGSVEQKAPEGDAGVHSMLYARVAMGRICHVSRTVIGLRQLPGHCDSLVVTPGQIERYHIAEQVWRPYTQNHVEVIIFDKLQVFPEYIMRYRLPSKSRTSCQEPCELDVLSDDDESAESSVDDGSSGAELVFESAASSVEGADVVFESAESSVDDGSGGADLVFESAESSVDDGSGRADLVCDSAESSVDDSSGGADLVFESAESESSVDDSSGGDLFRHRKQRRCQQRHVSETEILHLESRSHAAVAWLWGDSEEEEDADRSMECSDDESLCESFASLSLVGDEAEYSSCLGVEEELVNGELFWDV